jgi:hypothetical protein
LHALGRANLPATHGPIRLGQSLVLPDSRQTG